MSGKGVLGWLILAVALAVPAFMFWNWWKLLNNKPVEFGRKPVQGPVFNDTKMASQMPNPLAGSTATASGQPPAAVPQGSAAAPAQPPAAQAAPQPPAAPAPGTPPADPPATAGQPGAPAQPAAAGAATPETPPAVAAATRVARAIEEPTLRFMPKVNRDPMMSPMDVRRLAQMELEREDERRRLEEEERRRNEKPKAVRKVAPPIETTVQLYGITATPGSITAIVEVNGAESQIVKAGDILPNRVRIVKITQSTVTFQFKTKRWTRSLSQ